MILNFKILFSNFCLSVRYKEASCSPALWLKDSLNAFREAVLNLSQPNRPAAQHAPLERATPASPIALNAGALNSHYSVKSESATGQSTPTAANMTSGSAGSASSQWSQTQHHRTTMENLAKLMSSCVILRIEDFTLYRVTTSGRKQMPKEFVAGKWLAAAKL